MMLVFPDWVHDLRHTVLVDKDRPLDPMSGVMITPDYAQSVNGHAMVRRYYTHNEQQRMDELGGMPPEDGLLVVFETSAKPKKCDRYGAADLICLEPIAEGLEWLADPVRGVIVRLLSGLGDFPDLAQVIPREYHHDQWVGVGPDVLTKVVKALGDPKGVGLALQPQDDAQGGVDELAAIRVFPATEEDGRRLPVAILMPQRQDRPSEVAGQTAMEFGGDQGDG